MLLTADGHAKVGDFGLAKFLKDEDDVQEFSKLPCSPACTFVDTCLLGNNITPCTDAAPEQLIHQEVSFAVDIFSFGVVMLELLMGQPAPTNRRYPEIECVACARSSSCTSWPSCTGPVHHAQQRSWSSLAAAWMRALSNAPRLLRCMASSSATVPNFRLRDVPQYLPVIAQFVCVSQC